MTEVPQIAELPARSRWRTGDFIADLHLKPEEPGTLQAWERYLLRTPADAVFILGDLFEVWVGDDGASPGSFEDRCGQVLRAAGAAIDLFFMCGNRDFLLGQDYLARHFVRPLADPTVLRFPTQSLLLTHGDALCTDDVGYQQFRELVRSPDWQRTFLAKPLTERVVVAAGMRERSQQHHAGQQVYAHIDTALARHWLERADATELIHGHTHQPGDHALGQDAQGRPLLQRVLSDWHVEGHRQRMQVLRLTEQDGMQRVAPTET